MDHPAVAEARRTGRTTDYPYSGRRNEVGNDFFGNEINTGDEIMVLHDELYLKSELMQQAIEILEGQGATYAIAE